MDCPISLPPFPGQVLNARQQVVTVVEQEQMAEATFRIRLHCPEVATQITPGQFFMLRGIDERDPLLGRPFALFDIYEDDNGQPAGIDFGYVVIGKLTKRLPHWKAGDQAELWGPLGNGFPLPQAGHLMMVAGGIGQTPFLAVAREALGLHSYGQPTREVTERPSKVSFCYGARNANYLAGVERFELPGLETHLATDDGSAGHHGFVTDLLKQALDSDQPPTHVYTCGPEPMMHAVAKICEQSQVPCWLSLETPMACGFGACFSCVTKVHIGDGDWDYKRTCVEGPIFPAEQLVLD